MRSSRCGGNCDFLLKMLPRGSVGAEIGVDQGDFSARILRIVQPVRLQTVAKGEVVLEVIRNRQFVLRRT